MRLTYIAAIRFPTEKAHGAAIAKMCEAFEEKGVKVNLVIPNRKQVKQLRGVKWRGFYGIRKPFLVTRLWCIDWLSLNWHFPSWLNSLTFFLLVLSFQFSLIFYLLISKVKTCYTRDLLLAPLLLLFRKKVYLEVHNWPTNSFGVWYYKIIGKTVSGIICISKPLIKEFKKVGIESRKLLLAPSGVDKEFYKKRDKLALRKKFSLSLEKKIVLYSGSLQKDKGIFTFLEAAASLKKRKDILFVIVGGSFAEKEERGIIQQINSLSNLRYFGFKPYPEIPLFLALADVLVLPNSAKAKNPIYRKYTSPLKLYEYLASGRPTVVSKVAAFSKEFQDNNELLFFKPDNAEDLVRKVCRILDDKKLALLLGQSGRKMVTDADWEQRAQSVLAFIEQGYLIR